jgi:hypothetical protein
MEACSEVRKTLKHGITVKMRCTPAEGKTWQVKLIVIILKLIHTQSTCCKGPTRRWISHTYPTWLWGQAYLRFRHLSQFFMEPSDFMTSP